MSLVSCCHLFDPMSVKVIVMQSGLCNYKLNSCIYLDFFLGILFLILYVHVPVVYFLKRNVASLEFLILVVLIPFN